MRVAIIRVSGNAGSGKTVLCKRLAGALRYHYSATGSIFRDFALGRGLSIEEFYKEIKKDPHLERSVDLCQEDLMDTHTNLVIERRIPAFREKRVPVINVKIVVDTLEGVRRQLLRPENRTVRVAEMLERSEERAKEERERYLSLYGIKDHLDDALFQIVLDSTHLNENEVFWVIMEKLRPLLKDEVPG